MNQIVGQPTISMNNLPSSKARLKCGGNGPYRAAAVSECKNSRTLRAPTQGLSDTESELDILRLLPVGHMIVKMLISSALALFTSTGFTL